MADLPANGDGWERQGEPTRFGPDDLWRHINGGAEKYLAVGFESLDVAEYRAADGTEAVAERYLLTSRRASRDLFAGELPIAELKVDVGDDAQLDQQSLSFRRGACLVHVVVDRNEMGTGEALVALGQLIDEASAAGCKR